MTDHLTEVEHEALGLLSAVWRLVGEIVGQGPSREADLREMAVHVHGIQNAVLAQAAARAYPDRYRLMGGVPR